HLSNTQYERVESLDGLSFFEKLAFKKNQKQRLSSHCIAYGSVSTKDKATIYIRQQHSEMLEEFFEACAKLQYPIIGLYSFTFALCQHAGNLLNRKVKTHTTSPWVVAYFQIPHMPDFLIVIHKESPTLIRILHDSSKSDQEIVKIFKHVQGQSMEKPTFACFGDHMHLGDSLPWGQFISDNKITNVFELSGPAIPLCSPLNRKCFIWKTSLRLKTASLIIALSMIFLTGIASWYEHHLDQKIIAWESQKASTHEILLPQGFNTQKAIMQLSDLTYKYHPLDIWKRLNACIQILPPLMQFDYHQQQDTETIRLTFKANMAAEDILATLSDTLGTKDIVITAKPKFMDHTQAYMVTNHQDETDASLTLEENFHYKHDQ
ncbi:MAG: hypothetical protein J0G29_00145, partial [Alphaproteobacteria bacterium]|nr:hypothetical protein [Alphaproteobacteria bacterium]